MIKKSDVQKNIQYDSIVRVVRCNHVYELTYIDIITHSISDYKRISKDKMVNVVTGEVVDCKVSNSRLDNLVSLRKTIKKLRDLINANFDGSLNELFITLTYAENMTDLKRLYEDFKYFFKKLKKKYSGIEFLYIYTVEPQERGSWHIHLLLKALSVDSFYVPNDSVISKLWGHGFTKTQRLANVDNVGAYISAYLTDFIDDEGKKHKGARLYMYPSGMNIYRASRNCKKPIEYKTSYSEVKRYLVDDFKTYEVTYDVYDDSGNLRNVIKKEFYNLNR